MLLSRSPILPFSCLHFPVLIFPFGCQRDSGDDAAVASAAAQVTREAVLDFLFARAWIRREEISRRDDHPGNAEPALHRSSIDKRLLERIQLPVTGEPFDRRNGFAIALHRKHQARIDRTAVQEHGAGAAFTFGAALLRPGKRQLIADDVEQAVMWRDVDLVRRAVDGKAGLSSPHPRGRSFQRAAREDRQHRHAIVGAAAKVRSRGGAAHDVFDWRIAEALDQDRPRAHGAERKSRRSGLPHHAAQIDDGQVHAVTAGEALERTRCWFGRQWQIHRLPRLRLAGEPCGQDR